MGHSMMAAQDVMEERTAECIIVVLYLVCRKLALI